MVAIPTNYKMGTGLAATIMGQQAGLEAEQQGLANLMKGMQMPAEALKGQESAMLMQNPEYLQQKTQNTFIELQNTYSANQFEQTLNEVGRAKLALQASGGDPKSLYPYAEKLGAKPGDALFQAIDKDPAAVLDKYEKALTQMIANTGGAKQFGAERLQGLKSASDLQIAQLKEEGDTRRANISAGAQATSANKQLTGQMIQYSNQLRQELDNLNTNIRQLETKELDNAIMQDLIKRGNKNPSQQDVDKAKSTFKTALEDRKKLIEGDLATVRGSVGKQLGLKSGGSQEVINLD